MIRPFQRKAAENAGWRILDLGEEDQRLHDAIQARGEPGSVLVGWTVVAEWLEPNDRRPLTKWSSPNLSPWHVKGLLYQALHGSGWSSP